MVSGAAGTTTVTEVAVAASNRPAIWLPAVPATPRVMTSVVIPSTVPSTVSAERSGRAVMPATASAHRSRTPILGCTTPPR